MEGIERDLTNIAVLFITVAAIALIVSHPSGTSQVVATTGGTFGNLLSIVENPGGSGQSQNIMGSIVPYNGG